MTEEKPEPILVQYIRDRVEKKNKNFVMLFVGATGSGKSYSALRLSETLDKTFNIDRCCFKAKDFMNKVNSLVKESEEGAVIKGKVILWDEFGVEHNAREFMTISNRVINYFFQTSRHLNLIVIMTVPLLSFIDYATRKLMHSIGEMEGINSATKTANVKFKILQTNVMTGKEYPKYLRYTKNRKLFVSKKLKFKLPSAKLLEDYEKKKKEFTTGLNQEIMDRLNKEDLKGKSLIGLKPPSDAQERVAKLLLKNSAKKTCRFLNIDLTSVYAHKVALEKKGYVFKPIWKDKRVIRYEIEGFTPN